MTIRQSHEIAVRETIASSLRNRRLYHDDDDRSFDGLSEMIGLTFADVARQEFEDCARSIASVDDFKTEINRRARSLEEDAEKMAAELAANLDAEESWVWSLRYFAKSSARRLIGPLADRVILSRLKGEIAPADPPAGLSDRQALEDLILQLSDVEDLGHAEICKRFDGSRVRSPWNISWQQAHTKTPNKVKVWLSKSLKKARKRAVTAGNYRELPHDRVIGN